METDDTAMVDAILFRTGEIGIGLVVKQDGHHLDTQRLAEILEERLAAVPRY
jgi:hypothetical protein